MKTLITLLAAVLLQLAAFAQIRVNDTAPDSIAHIPLNRTFIVNPNQVHGEGTRVCAKVTVSLDSLAAILTDIHGAAPDSTNENGKLAYVWHDVQYPNRFYLRHSTIMAYEKRDDYTLICFNTAATRLQTGKNKKGASIHGSRRMGASYEELGYVQAALNQLVYHAPPGNPFDLRRPNTWYISAQERETRGFHTIREIEHYPDGETGGMHENWSVLTVSMNEEGLQWDWAPTHLPEGFEFNYDTVVANARRLNGTELWLHEGKISSFGGSGYGTFDYTDYFWFGDTVAVGMTYVTGHGFDTNVRVTVNRYNLEGQLSSRATYGSYPDDHTAESLLEAIQTAASDSSRQIDTTVFEYGPEGMLYSMRPTIPQMRAQNIPHYPRVAEFDEPLQFDPLRNAFYQVYIGNEPAETVVQAAIGYKPFLVIFEVYRNGAVLLKLDKTGKQYAYAGLMVLD